VFYGGCRARPSEPGKEEGVGRLEEPSDLICGLEKERHKVEDKPVEPWVSSFATQRL